MIKPFVKWAGGKEGELKYILPMMPDTIHKYIEPFVGGGALYFALSDNINIKQRFINDFSSELISLYRVLSNSFKSFENEIKVLMHNWCVLEEVVKKYGDSFVSYCRKYQTDKNETLLKDNLTSFLFSKSDAFNGLLRAGDNALISNFENEIKKYLIRKIKRINCIDVDNKFTDEEILSNIETALKAGYYTHIRNLYNQKESKELHQFFNLEKKCAYFYFLREYCYSSMFRYNKKGEFNVPYGGMGYNKKNILNKVNTMKADNVANYLAKTEISNNDFEVFLNGIELTKNDFVFLDPPYDSEFSEYAQNSFSKNDQIRLANWAKTTKAKVMLVIKNTDFIYGLYNNKKFNISSFDKKYMVNFNNRNDRKVKHLLITNYWYGATQRRLFCNPNA